VRHRGSCTLELAHPSQVTLVTLSWLESMRGSQLSISNLRIFRKVGLKMVLAASYPEYLFSCL